MPKVKVYVRNNQKDVKVPTGIRLLIRKCCQAVLVTEKFEHDAEVSVSFVDNKEIRQLNKIYRNKDKYYDSTIDIITNSYTMGSTLVVIVVFKSYRLSFSFHIPGLF